jgi:hypothetical protein
VPQCLASTGAQGRRFREQPRNPVIISLAAAAIAVRAGLVGGPGAGGAGMLPPTKLGAADWGAALHAASPSGFVETFATPTLAPLVSSSRMTVEPCGGMWGQVGAVARIRGGANRRALLPPF